MKLPLVTHDCNSSDKQVPTVYTANTLRDSLASRPLDVTVVDARKSRTAARNAVTLKGQCSVVEAFRSKDLAQRYAPSEEWSTY